MKKLILLGLVAVGVSAATTARAGGFSINIAIGRPCPPIFVPAAPPIVVPPPVGFVSCERPVVIRDCDRDERFRAQQRREQLERERCERERRERERCERERHAGFGYWR